MVRNTKETASDLPTAAEIAADKEEESQNVDPWADLPEAEVVEYHRSSVVVDVMKEVPEPIRTRVLQGYKAYVDERQRLDSASQSHKSVLPQWRIQQCGTPERAAEFVRLAKLYGANVEPRLTVYTKIHNEAPSTVRYNVRPFASRGSK